MISPSQHCIYPASSDDTYICPPTNPGACEPCRKLAELGRKIKTQDTTDVAMERERLELKSQMNINHDALTRHLPLEITTEIFIFSLPENIVDLSLKTVTSRYTLAAPLVLSAVCRRWRNIVRSTPLLWADLPLYITRHNADALLVLAKDWLERSDPCLLSINIFASKLTAQLEALIQLVSRYAFRWAQLAYKGPNEGLDHFWSSAEGVSHIRTLILRAFVPTQLTWWHHGKFELGNLILRPTRLEMASIFLLKAVTIEWSYLTEVTIANSCISDCLEVLRSAPRLTRCALNPRFNPHDPADTAHLELHADHPVVHPAIVELTLTGAHFPGLLAHVVCPSLRTLRARRIFGVQRAESLRPMPEGWMDRIVAFVQLSRCPVTDFSVVGFAPSQDVVEALCRGMPTLRHLHVEWADDPDVPVHDYLFALLARTSTVGGKTAPLYLPDLRSLTVHHNGEVGVDWALLPAIFCRPRSAVRLRSTLDVVAVCIGLGKEGMNASGVVVGEETRQELLSLRKQGVKLKIQVGKDKRDVI
ncbi:hypothetical protein BJ912DRAFT_163987 [Pholiota molesta]|nr:hypothetical protein BJ912DRAFT_163987 [Pholiota molesta]